jgi:uncharacterized RDD family membrane protein YckC
MMGYRLKLATLRLFGFGIDAAILLSYALSLHVIAMFFDWEWTSIGNSSIVAAVIAYFAVSEAISNGQTIGKKVAGIRTVNRRYSQITLYESLLRASTLVLAPLILPLLGSLLETLFFMGNDVAQNVLGLVYVSSQLSVPITLILNRSCGVHDAVSETRVEFVRNKNQPRRAWPTASVKQRTLAVYLILVIAISFVSGIGLATYGQVIDEIADPQEYVPALHSDTHVGDTVHNISGVIYSFPYLTDALARKMIDGSTYLDIEKPTQDALWGLMTYTFEKSPSPTLPDEIRFEKWNRDQVDHIVVPVTWAGLLSADAQRIILAYLRRQTQFKRALFVEFRMESRSSFFTLRVSKTVGALSTSEHEFLAVEPDDNRSLGGYFPLVLDGPPLL